MDLFICVSRIDDVIMTTSDSVPHLVFFQGWYLVPKDEEERLLNSKFESRKEVNVTREVDFPPALAERERLYYYYRNGKSKKPAIHLTKTV